MDQVGFKVLVIQDPTDGCDLGRVTRRYKTPLPWPHDQWVDEPYVYGSSRTQVIQVGGRKSCLSNGRRVLLSHQGRPYPGEVTPVGSSQVSLDNQLTNNELETLVGLAGDSAGAPWRWQLDRFEIAFNQLLQQVTQPLSKSKGVRLRLAVTRLEVYTEFDLGGSTKDYLVTQINRALRRKFMKPKQSFDGDDGKPSYQSWFVPAGRVVPGSKSKKGILVKLYHKGGRIRLEVRADGPLLRRGEDNGLREDFDILSFLSGLDTSWSERVARDVRDVFDQLRRTGSVLEEVLTFICQEISKVTSLRKARFRQEDLLRAIGIVLPQKGKTSGLHGLAKLLAVGGMATRHDLKRLEIGSNDLRRLADSSAGFLDKVYDDGQFTSNSETTLNGQRTRRRVACFEVNRDHLMEVIGGQRRRIRPAVPPKVVTIGDRLAVLNAIWGGRSAPLAPADFQHLSDPLDHYLHALRLSVRSSYKLGLTPMIGSSA